MHYLTRRFQFSSSHRLDSPLLDDAGNEEAYGLCRNVHGHNYRLEVTVRGEPDPKTGFFGNVMDLKALVDEHITDPCEHRYLNDLPLFAGRITTMESIASRIWKSSSRCCVSGIWNCTRFWSLRLTTTSCVYAGSRSAMTMHIIADFAKPLSRAQRTEVLLAIAPLSKAERIRFVRGDYRAVIIGEALGIERVRRVLDEAITPERLVSSLTHEEQDAVDEAGLLARHARAFVQ